MRAPASDSAVSPAHTACPQVPPRGSRRHGTALPLHAPLGGQARRGPLDHCFFSTTTQPLTLMRTGWGPGCKSFRVSSCGRGDGPAGKAPGAQRTTAVDGTSWGPALVPGLPSCTHQEQGALPKPAFHTLYALGQMTPSLPSTGRHQPQRDGP